MGAWNLKNHYLHTFVSLGSVVELVWSWNFFHSEGMVSCKLPNTRPVTWRPLESLFTRPKLRGVTAQNTQFEALNSIPWETGCVGAWNLKNHCLHTFMTLGCDAGLVWPQNFLQSEGILSSKLPSTPRVPWKSFKTFLNRPKLRGMTAENTQLLTAIP